MAAHSRFNPSWQGEPCPDWCVVEHREGDLPDDRIHDGAARYVPVVHDDRQGSSVPRVRSIDLLLVRSRRIGETDDWIFVGEPDRPQAGLVLTPESASRVAHAILDQVSDG